MDSRNLTARSRSPFDEIRHVDEDERGQFEWWSAREAMPFLGYANWQNMQNVIRKAKAACRNRNCQVADHFIDVSKMRPQGGPAQQDVQLSRFGMYLLAMNGDPEKREIALAQSYFVEQTRRAELHLPTPGGEGPTLAPVPPPGVSRPWSERISMTFRRHRLYIVRNFPPGSFSTITATFGEILTIEDELIRHLMPLKFGDLPDGSIGGCWGHVVRNRCLPGPIGQAPLEMPHLPIGVVQVHVYAHGLLPEFLPWLNDTYFREKLPQYFNNKKEWKELRLSAASAADNACLQLTEQHAHLPPPTRLALENARGFIPVQRALPAPRQES